MVIPKSHVLQLHNRFGVSMGGIVGTDELYPAGETVALLAAREEAGPRRAASSGGLKPVTKRKTRFEANGFVEPHFGRTIFLILLGQSIWFAPVTPVMRHSLLGLARVRDVHSSWLATGSP